MPFNNLQDSAALTLQRYVDVDHFHESERYANARSIPLSVKDFCVLRASLALPSSTLSLVWTFPRIVHGYGIPGRMLIVVPMSGVSSTRLNGREVGQSLILIRGNADCTVVEPEGRLVAILSLRPEMLGPAWQEPADGQALLQLAPDELVRLQARIRGALEAAARVPEGPAAEGMLVALQETVLGAFGEAVGAVASDDRRKAVLPDRYKTVVDQVDLLIDRDPIDTANERLAEQLGISVRTLHNASRSVCAMPIHRYSRLMRLWSVRRQLRTGATGLTVKASALAHGFWHISQFTNAYHESFGELPSATLANARHGNPLREAVLNSH